MKAPPRCPSCTRRQVERGRLGNWECPVMPCHGPKGTDLVHVPSGEQTCPECGTTMVTAASTQDALFWIHGFGWGEQQVRTSCPACGHFSSYDTVVPPTHWSRPERAGTVS